MLTLALLALRLLLALVFIAAAVGKLRDRAAFAETLTAFGAPRTAVAPLALLIPALELGLAPALLTTATVSQAATLAAVTLLVFTGAVVSNLARGRRPACACFGAAAAEPIGALTLIRNLVLLVATVVLARASSPVVPTDATAALSPATWLSALGAVLVVAFVLGWYANDLRVSNARLAERVSVLERQLAQQTPDVGAGGLARGTSAPDFDLPRLEGDRASLTSLRRRGRPVLLIFADAMCPSCHQLWPDIARWQTKHANALTVAAVCSGADQTIEMKVMGIPVTDVLLEGDAKVGDAFALSLRPSAVVVDETGLIASRSVAGVAAIRALADEWGTHSIV